MKNQKGKNTMKTYREVKASIMAPEVQMGSTTLRQAFPVNSLEQVDPFILLHHFDYTKGPHEHDFSVPPHPHRGFSPITFIYEGAVQHTDSLGNDRVINDNEVQWINAARGIIHGEKIGKEFAEKGGRFQGIQLWINTPKAHKMDPPSYQPITKDEIVLVEKEGVEFRIVSGTYEGKKGPAKSDVFTAMLRMKAGSNFNLKFPATNNVAIYVLEGQLRINEERFAAQHQLLLFKNTEGEILVQANENAKLLIMAADPINEPLVTHGPFVMNTQTEILEAMRDYQNGKMGFLY
ncbi:pirin [Sphingobacteriaceae bacterium]|nr:pirin [Sphingobacteriaceae bacterium]